MNKDQLNNNSKIQIFYKNKIKQNKILSSHLKNNLNKYKIIGK